MRGGVVMGLIFFILALAVIVVYISPMNAFINMAQQSDNLNCKGYIHNGNTSDPLSFNATLNGGDSGDSLSCLTIKLFLPFLLLVFLVGGIASVLGGRGEELFGLEPDYGISAGGY